jgi:hypothetical protein
MHLSPNKSATDQVASYLADKLLAGEYTKEQFVLLFGRVVQHESLHAVFKAEADARKASLKLRMVLNEILP